MTPCAQKVTALVIHEMEQYYRPGWPVWREQNSPHVHEGANTPPKYSADTSQPRACNS